MTTKNTLPAVSLAPELGSVETNYPAPGEYWKSTAPIKVDDTEASETIPTGTPFLVTDITVIQGEFHSAKLFVPAPYGLGEESRIITHEYTAEEFLDLFEPCRRDPTEIVRGKHEVIATALAEFQTLKHDFSGRIKRLAEPAAGATADHEGASTLPVKADVLVDIERFHNEIAEKTERATELIKVNAQEIQAQLAASMHKPKQMLKKLTQVLGRIAAYSGEDVVVRQVADGPRTTTPQPLTIYQAMRYMDEEMLVHIADGGADYRDWDEFVKHLGATPKTLNRLIPAEHGICLMRYRREDKEYSKGTSMAARFANAQENKPNKIGFLLYRDGDSLWTIDSPVTAHEVPSLFPTAEQLDSPFHRRSHWGEDSEGEEVQIRFDDLEYSKSWDEHEKTVFAYRMLLLVLWGLRDRMKLFAWLPNTSMDRLIHDPNAFAWVHDDEYLLGEGRTNIFEWVVKNQSEYLQSGVRVLCDWRALLNEKTAPGFKRTLDMRVDPASCIGDSYCSVLVARRDGNEYYVECPTLQPVYLSHREDLDKRVKVKVTFSRWIRDNNVSGQHGTGCLVLDAVTIEDVERYIESRQAREHYVHFIDTLFVLRDVLRRDISEQAPVRAALEARHPGVDITQAFTDAVRTWRAARRGRQVPQPDAPGFTKAVAQLDEHVGAAVSADTADTLLARLPEDENPSALARSGRGRYVTYSQAPPEAHPLTPPLFHLRKQWLQGRNGQLRLERESLAHYTVPLPASETLLWQADGQQNGDGEKESKVWFYGLTPHQYGKLTALCEADGYLNVLDGQMHDVQRMDLLRRLADEKLDMQSVAIQVLGSAFVRRENAEMRRSEDLLVWSVEETLLPLLWNSLSEGQRWSATRWSYFYRSGLERKPMQRNPHLFVSRPNSTTLSNIRLFHGLAVSKESGLYRSGSGPAGWGWKKNAWQITDDAVFDQGFGGLVQATLPDEGHVDEISHTPEAHLRAFGWEQFIGHYEQGGEPWAELTSDQSEW